MIKKQLQISIPKPCTEDWQAMGDNNSGKHCLVCQKNVIDFSRMSNNEIIHYFENYKGTTCGRFTQKQLANPIINTNIPRLKNQWAWTFSTLFITMMTNSQTPLRFESTKISTPSVSKLKKENHNLLVENQLHGIVLDENNKPIVGASLVLKNTKVSILTNIDGQFEIKIPAYVIKDSSFEIDIFHAQFENCSLKIGVSEVTNNFKIILKEKSLPIQQFHREELLILGAINIDNTVAALPLLIVRENNMEIKSQYTNAITLKGVVKSPTNEPLISASIVVKGTTLGTLTDVNGHFVLQIPSQDIGNQAIEIWASCVGYETQLVKINPKINNQNLTIVLNEAPFMGEIVVVHQNVFQRTKNKIRYFFRRRKA